MTTNFSLHTIYSDLSSFFKNKALFLLKETFFISLIFATILYILMRVFFIGSEFEPGEAIALFIKTLLVTWSYINAWKLICLVVVWIEVTATSNKFRGHFKMHELKKAA